MARVGQQQSAGRGSSKRQAAQANQKVSGPGGLLVRFLNTQTTELNEEARKLHQAMREVVDYMLEAASPETRKQPVPLLRFHDSMNVLYHWYAQHPYVFDLMDWKSIAEAPLAPVFGPSARLAEKERGAALAAFDLWLVLFLADRKDYRLGKGLVFRNARGQRLRLLRCTVCEQRYFPRWLGPGAVEGSVCSECQPPRIRGRRDPEYRRKKILRRVAWLQKVWEKTPWRQVGTIDYEPALGDHAQADLYVPKGVLKGVVFGPDAGEEQKLMEAALGEFGHGKRSSGGRQSR